MDASLAQAVSRAISLTGTLVDIFGVLTIIAGIVWATFLFLTRRDAPHQYSEYRVRIGRSLLLGLEILVAADIIKTVAVEPSFENLGVLGLLVVIRTFLNWTLELEIEGHWPWQRSKQNSESATRTGQDLSIGSGSE